MQFEACSDETRSLQKGNSQLAPKNIPPPNQHTKCLLNVDAARRLVEIVAVPPLVATTAPRPRHSHHLPSRVGVVTNDAVARRNQLRRHGVVVVHERGPQIRCSDGGRVVARPGALATHPGKLVVGVTNRLRVEGIEPLTRSVVRHTRHVRGQRLLLLNRNTVDGPQHVIERRLATALETSCRPPPPRGFP